MVTPRQIRPKPGDVLVLVGTSKGAFLLHSNASRRSWKLGGPYLAGNGLYALAFDGRAGRSRIWAGAESGHFGAVLTSSDDFGKTWAKVEKPQLAFPAGSGANLKRVWSIRPGREGEPDVLYAGTEPAALWESRDAGKTWALNAGLFGHPHRAKWEPGGGGQCLHTIVPDVDAPGRMLIAVSTGGCYITEDGGRSWAAQNKNIKVTFMPETYPEFGQCVHKIVQAPNAPGRFYLQHHWGVYRSDDAGATWKPVEKGLPSTFGFAMAAHPRCPDTAFVLPIESDGFRCTPEGKLRVYRTTDAGKTWKAMTKGLPQKNALELVLRDGMDVDGCDPAGVYFGTKSGKVWASRDEGSSWTCIADGLPQVNCVKVAMVPRKAKKGRR